MKVLTATQFAEHVQGLKDKEPIFFFINEYGGENYKVHKIYKDDFHFGDGLPETMHLTYSCFQIAENQYNASDFNLDFNHSHPYHFYTDGINNLFYVLDINDIKEFFELE